MTLDTETTVTPTENTDTTATAYQPTGEFVVTPLVEPPADELIITPIVEAAPAPVEPEPWSDLHECPNGHIEQVHRGLMKMDQGKNAVKYTYGYHCLKCDAGWTASEIFKL